MTFQIGTIAIGSDHRAREIVDGLATHLEPLGWTVRKHYGGDADSVDYPCISNAVTSEVVSGEAVCGVLICGSGIGMSMAANKADGIRAALVHEPNAAEMSRRHNDANVLCMAANSPMDSDYNAIVDTWLATEFEGGRHQRRVELMR
ncbi:MAG: RpiB/LacA/LacB family sugar-phosphate isomerase [Phycisphaerae bacterium]|jgi:RpiB/LacA/LacB family sugar-phosphate isomerase|nr:RpiB/LacA/LacB family sugar-phosphate isomerase [Phycisphaerae bacterium]MBT5366125.1 RpiB/LacA/LacB family sugar-phosphate isomerase [Phycisphaerae bacterium]MBT6268867.1 RpiB/LacA/LacB family sugar-phosphate isomerase [Phycisphaerae bacterium]MBT6282218.1 RpiB/LacA/LacB family sugar-phosphate isomerase [Phycisphaerae bacterium]